MAIISESKKHHSILTSGELLNITQDMLDAMSPEELAVLQFLLEDPSMLGAFSELDYDREVLSPEAWLESGYHSGIYGRSMYDPLKQDLCDIVHGNFFEIIMTGALGTGKTYLGRAVTVYNLYKLSCLKSPQKFWGLSETTKIAFVSIGIKKSQIEKVVFGEFGPELETIDYFKNDHKIVASSQEHGFTFEKNLIIRPGGSNEGDIIGEAVFGAVVDEINFRTSEKKANDKLKKSQTGMSPTDKLVDAIRARIESRFQRGKILGGFIHISSSKRSEFDFTEKRAISRSNDPTVFIRDRAIWEVKDPKNYSGKKFKVFVGTAGIPSEKLTDDRYIQLKDNMPEGCMIIEVPVEHEPQFSEGRDLDQAIRDVAGVSTVGLDKYFKDRYALEEMFGARLPEYLTHVGGASIGGEVIFGTPLEIPTTNFVCDRETGKPLKVIRHPRARRVAHIDVGLTGDRLGLTIGHIVDWVDVPVYDAEIGKDMVERMPRVELDLAIGFTPPDGGEIILERIRGLIYQLRSMGMPIYKITMDSFQCLTGETEIFVVGHGPMPIKEVATKFKDKKFYVLSRDIKTGELKYAMAKNARRTGEQVGNLVTVSYNNGNNEFTCTPDHLVLLKSGQYCKARNLKEGDEIDSSFRVFDWQNCDEDDLKNKLYIDSVKTPEFPVMREILKCALNARKQGDRLKDFELGCLTDLNFGANIDKPISRKYLKEIINSWSEWCNRLHTTSVELNSPKESPNPYKMGMSNIQFEGDERHWVLNHLFGSFGLSELSLYTPDKETYDATKRHVFGRNFQNFFPLEKSKDINFKVTSVVKTSRIDDVFDIEVPMYSNFCLASGVIVHNSRDSLQIFRDKGYEADLLSVDKTTEPYDNLKRAILERRIKTNSNIILRDEILGLEKDEKTNKIDHGINTSKDISDSVAGVVQVLTEEKPVSTPRIYHGQDKHRPKLESNWLIDSEIKKKPKPNVKKSATKVFF